MVEYGFSRVSASRVCIGKDPNMTAFSLNESVRTDGLQLLLLVLLFKKQQLELSPGTCKKHQKMPCHIVLWKICKELC